MRSRRSSVVALSIGLAGFCTPMQAAEESTLAETVVTGERQQRLLLETASSVVVVTGEDIAAASGADRLDQILALAPNVQFGSGGEGPTIRGQDSTGVLRDLPAFIGGTRPRATLQIDGRAVNFNEFVFGTSPLWDVERVEIFRTPQSTTQGRNSIAGAIFVTTRDPEYDWGGRVRGVVGEQSTRQGSIALTGPLVDEQLAFRVAGDVRRSRTSSHITDVIDGADPNDDDFSLVRVKLRADPRAMPGARFTVSYVRNESDSPQVEGIAAPFAARRDPSPGYGVFSNSVDSLTGVAAVELSPGLHWRSTLSWGDASITRRAPTGLGQTRNRVRDRSVESVLSGRSAANVEWLAGAHYLQSDLDQFIDLAAILGAGSFDDDQRSLGLFTETTFRLSPRLSLTTGLRYQRDTQDRAGGLGTQALQFPVRFDAYFTAWLPKVSATYAIAEQARIGALIQRASNPGGTSLNFDTGEQDDFGPETLWNAELFARGRFAEGRVGVGVNVFHIEASGAQRAQTRAYRVPGGPTAFWAEITNVPEARSRGAEAELSAQVTRAWSVRTALGLLRTRITRTSIPVDPILGKEFQRSPGVTATAAVDWRPSVRWRVTVQSRTNTSYFSDDANSPALRVGGSTVLDAQVGWSGANVSVFAYARNVFDRFYLLQLNSPTRGTAGDPRTLGVGLELSY